MRKIEPNSPAFIRAFWPTMQFSTALMVENRRMFWNVRAMPSFMITSGRPPVTLRSSNTIKPSVGL